MRKNVVIIIILIVILVLSSCSSKEAPNTSDNVVKDSPKENVVQNPVDKPTEQPSLDKKLSETYQRMMDDGKYTMKYKTTMNNGNDDYEVEITLAVLDDMSAMIMDGEDFESVILNKDNSIYMIDHENRTILIMPEGNQVNQEEPTTSPENLKNYDLQYIGSGREDFLGKERQYEEYSFEGGSTKYYFDGDDLDGMVMTMNGQTTIMEIEDFSDTVNENLFILPEGYQEMKIGM